MSLLDVRVWLICTVLVVTGCTRDAEQAEDTQKEPESGISIEDAHLFLPPPGQKQGAVYLRMHNYGKLERQVVDVTTSVASSAMIHRSYYDEGMMRMRHVHHLSVAPDETVLFQPAGYHIMLMDIDQLPEPGNTFPMIMGLDQGQTLHFNVEVKAQH